MQIYTKFNGKKSTMSIISHLSKSYALGLKIYKCVMFLICFIRRLWVSRMEERWVIISVPV